MEKKDKEEILLELRRLSEKVDILISTIKSERELDKLDSKVQIEMNKLETYQSVYGKEEGNKCGKMKY